MGPEKFRNVGKSQWVLMMINPMISTRTRTGAALSRGSRRRWAQGDQAAHATHIPAIPALLLTLSMLWCAGGGVGGTARRCGEQRLGPTELHLRIMHGPMHVM
eukprot:COSAG01_NODE_888_length_12915_cov_10.708723_6_plen_103_part_00